MPRDDIQPTAFGRLRPGIVRRHVLIAGTGRAGTSFLIRYLTACGLETQLTGGGDPAAWDERAQAGYEDPLWGALHDAEPRPYVIKSPWAHQDIDEALADPRLRLDAVIIPMRDLAEAAGSRSIIELQACHQADPVMAERRRSWLLTGHTPGGVIYSLDPLDQARLLATGFHELLQRLVAADVPVILLDCRRMIADADYLRRKLADILPAGLTKAAAARAHAALADPRKLRATGEIGGEARRGMPDGPSYDRLDRAALAREVRRLRAALSEAETTTRAAIARSLTWQVACRLQRLARSAPLLARLAHRLLAGHTR